MGGSVLGISHDWHSHRNPFETCWKLDLGNNNDHQYCWSKSYYKSAKVGGWWQCVPNGRGWYALERASYKSCRPPCQEMHHDNSGDSDDDVVNDDAPPPDPRSTPCFPANGAFGGV